MRLRAESGPGGIAVEATDDQPHRLDFEEAVDTQRALFSGREAGSRGLPATDNPHAYASAEGKAWERGRTDLVAA